MTSYNWWTIFSQKPIVDITLFSPLTICHSNNLWKKTLNLFIHLLNL